MKIKHDYDSEISYLVEDSYLPISSTNKQAEDESHCRSVDSALNYTEYRDPASVIKETDEESSTDSNSSSNYSPKGEADELCELLDSIVVGTESRGHSLVDLINTNSDNLDVTTPHFDENPSSPVDHPGDCGSIHTANNIEPESLSAPQEFTK